MSASPSRTVSTSSTGCEWVGAPAPGATCCSNMHNCVAPFMADASIRLCTPGRQVSHSGGLMTCIEIFLSLRKHFRAFHANFAINHSRVQRDLFNLKG